MGKFNKLLYWVIGVSILIICMPIIVIFCPIFKSFVLLIFHNRENAYQYLQFVGSFLGVIVTISVTVILQEKQKHENELKVKKKAKLSLYTQLKNAFDKYLEAQRSNNEYKTLKDSNSEIFGPRKIFIDPNWMKDLAELKLILNAELYENICSGYDSIINMYDYYKEIDNNLERIKTQEENEASESNAILDNTKGIKQKNKIKKEILANVNCICYLYTKKYEEVLNQLVNFNI